ncbi:hypothetical protein Chor_001567 [Crotalus horridus]
MEVEEGSKEEKEEEKKKRWRKKRMKKEVDGGEQGGGGASQGRSLKRQPESRVLEPAGVDGTCGRAVLKRLSSLCRQWKDSPAMFLGWTTNEDLLSIQENGIVLLHSLFGEFKKKVTMNNVFKVPPPAGRSCAKTGSPTFCWLSVKSCTFWTTPPASR